MPFGSRRAIKTCFMEGPPSGDLLFSYRLAVAAATDHQKRDDDYPDEVIIKKIAKAVIHDRTSLNSFGAVVAPR